MSVPEYSVTVACFVRYLSLNGFLFPRNMEKQRHILRGFDGEDAIIIIFDHLRHFLGHYSPYHYVYFCGFEIHCDILVKKV